MKETRVYVVNKEVEQYDKDIKDMSDEEFMSYAEEQGGVYTLKGFEDEFNNGETLLSTEFDVIRFIEVEV